MALALAVVAAGPAQAALPVDPAAGASCAPVVTESGRDAAYAVVADPARATAALRRAGLPDVRRSGGGVVVFGGDRGRARRALADAGLSATVVPDHTMTRSVVPNDPGYPTQWALPAVGAPAAWDRTKGSASVVVAVIDSGVDLDHRDLVGKVLPGYNAVTGTALAAGNSDFANHGTGVTGVIAAATNNGVGLAGLGWDTRVLPIKDGDGVTSASATVAGIRYAADVGARIVNLSEGSPCADPNLAGAVAYAQGKGALVVASAGNEAGTGNSPQYPAALPGVLAVGATGFFGNSAVYSNTGEYIDLVAPGGSADGNPDHNVAVLTPGGGTSSRAGTSYSAPMVAAAAALLLGARPTLTAADLSRLLTSTATDLGPAGRDNTFGNGLLNVDAALAAAGVVVPTRPPPPVSAPPPPPPPPPPTTGYRMAASDGGMFTFGDARFLGSTGDLRLNSPVVGLATSPRGGGYWLVAADGGIFTFGDARFVGSTGDLRLNSPIVAMAATPSGGGYWLVAADGGIFTFGDARFLGSTGGQRLGSPIVAMAATPSGGGYWLVAADGGVYAFGNAPFLGPASGPRLNRPVVGLAATPSGNGYWSVASDGGIFAFGDAGFYGSTGDLRLNRPIVGLTSTRGGAGYLMVASDGGVFTFGNAPFLGSTGDLRLNQPVVALTAS